MKKKFKRKHVKRVLQYWSERLNEWDWPNDFPRIDSEEGERRYDHIRGAYVAVEAAIALLGEIK